LKVHIDVTQSLMLNGECCVMSSGSIIKLTPTNTPNYQIHSSNKPITDQIIQLLHILASASAPSSTISFPTKASKLEQRWTPQDHSKGKGGEPLATFRGKRCFDTGQIGFCHCAAILQTQVPKLCTDLDLSLLYILTLRRSHN